MKEPLLGHQQSSSAPKSWMTLHWGTQDKGELEHVSLGEIMSWCKKNILSTLETIRHWNILLREVAEISSIEIFNTWLESVLDLMSCF